MNDEFKPIETQEELDKIISSRLARKEEQVKKSFEGYISPAEFEKYKQENQHDEYKSKYEKLSNDYRDMEAKVKQYETNSVKMEISEKFGLPAELRNRLQGNTREELEKDAEALSEIFKAKKQAPQFEGEPTMTDSDRKKAKEDAIYRKLLKQL